MKYELRSMIHLVLLKSIQELRALVQWQPKAQPVNWYGHALVVRIIKILRRLKFETTYIWKGLCPVTRIGIFMENDLIMVALSKFILHTG